MELRQAAFWTDTRLIDDLDAIARQHRTTRSQVLRAAIAAGLPALRRGEKPVPPPVPTGRPPRTRQETTTP